MLPVIKSLSFSNMQNALCALADLGMSDGLVFTSDSENEIFCDSVDSVEQLSNIKVLLIYIPKAEI